MRLTRAPLLVILAIANLPVVGRADEAPSYAKQIRPFLSRYCLECHNAKREEGGFNVETLKSLMEGVPKGPVVVAGKANDSLIVSHVEGTDKPKMPPKTARQPKAEEIGLLRAWIDAGAKDDSSSVVVTLPEIKPRVVASPPVAALAYAPDGNILAAGGRNEVLFIDPTTGDVVGKVGGQSGKVTAVAFSLKGDLFAAASGSAGATGEIRLYKAVPGATPSGEALKLIQAHKDVIHAVAFSPDGKMLASSGYDRLIQLWDTATGDEIRTLKDHSDAVYSIDFNGDGTLLASSAADRAVKVWDVATGKRLFTLGESTDWVYSVAWSPDGRHLAAAGVDKSIRVWEVSAQAGKILHSVFAHEGPVTRLTYAPDGKTLYSVSEDRGVKAWDAEHLKERITYPRQADVPLAFAVRRDRKQIALGRYDGKLLLLDEATGKTQSEPLPAKPKPPVLSKVSPQAATRGQSIKLTIEGKNLDAATEVMTSIPDAKVELHPGGSESRDLSLTIPPTVLAGSYTLTMKTPGGTSAALPFYVDLFTPITVAEGRQSPRSAPLVKLPATLVGFVAKAGAIDYFRFNVEAGQEIGVQAVTNVTGAKPDLVMQILDADGELLTESDTGLLGYKSAKAGTVTLSVRDREYRGDNGMSYRLQVGDVPIVTAVFPLGVRRGTDTEVTVDGVNLGSAQSAKVKARADATVGSRIPVPVSTPGGAPLGDPSVVVGEFPEVMASSKAMTVPVPGTANGRIDAPRATNTFRFTAQKGQRLLLEVESRRIGSPLDSYIEILDTKGQPLPRATLRCLSKTYVTFRDHDSAGGGIRIESWTELAMRDYLLVGDELMRIRELPKNPDDDCQFFTLGGRRQGFLGTTPTHHPQGQPMCKVSIHPPGTTFPPNGLPVVTLYYRNDDGGGAFGKDSRLVFDPPADGDYQVRVGDSRGKGGPQHAYRLTIRPPRPSFTVSLSPTAPQVAKGGATSINVSVNRADEFEGPIEVHLGGLPAGFSAPPTTIPAGEFSTAFALAADPGATVPEKTPSLKLVARAKIDGQDVVREATGALPKVIEPGDIVTTTSQDAVTIKPGSEVRLQVHVERRNDFKGRIPIEVRGLPYGVRVLDIGLNGILITEKETTRTVVLFAEPWVEPTEHPFVVLARNEAKNTEHAARSVLLKVAAK